MRFPLKEIQSTRTQRPTSGSSYPYVEIVIGDLLNQRITQLQLEQVCISAIQGQRDKLKKVCGYIIYHQCFYTHLMCLNISVYVCVPMCVFPGPGVVPRHCHAHGEHVVSQRKETHPATK